MMILVIHHAELSGCHALYQLFSMYDERGIACAFKGGGMIFGRVAYLEAHVHGILSLPWVLGKEVEEKKERNVLVWVLAIIGAVAAVAAVAYAVYHFFFAQDYLEDFEDDFEDEADEVEEDDDDFFEDEGEN